MKQFEITIETKKFEFTGSDDLLWAHVSKLMADHAPPGVYPTIRETTPALASDPMIVPSAPTNAIVVSQRGVTLARPTATVAVAPIVEGEINEEGRLRAIRDRDAMIRAGFIADPTVYAIGSQVNSTGVANARKYRAEWEALPDIREALTILRDRVRAENRVDVILPAKQLRMTDKGALRVPGHGEVSLSRAVFSRLISKLEIPGGADYLGACTPALRAENLNRWFTGEGSNNSDWSASDMKLRLREAEHGPELYAIVGQGYTAVDSDTIAESLLRALPEGGRGVAFYDGFRIKVDAQWASTVAPESYVAGEVFRAGMSFCSDDTGSGALNGWATLLRNLCLNLFILQDAKQRLLHERHAGDPSRIARSLDAATHRGEASIRHFIEAWDTARGESLASLVRDSEDHARDLSGESLTQLAWGAFLGAQKAKLVSVTQKEIPLVLRAFHREECNDRTGVVNAFTRFAHESGINPWRAQEIETQATALLAIPRLPWLDPTKHA